jgi:hypothetical protein
VPNVHFKQFKDALYVSSPHVSLCFRPTPYERAGSSSAELFAPHTSAPRWAPSAHIRGAPRLIQRTLPRPLPTWSSRSNRKKNNLEKPFFVSFTTDKGCPGLQLMLRGHMQRKQVQIAPKQLGEERRHQVTVKHKPMGMCAHARTCTHTTVYQVRRVVSRQPYPAPAQAKAHSVVSSTTCERILTAACATTTRPTCWPCAHHVSCSATGCRL